MVARARPMPESRIAMLVLDRPVSVEKTKEIITEARELLFFTVWGLVFRVWGSIVYYGAHNVSWPPPGRVGTGVPPGPQLD